MNEHFKAAATAVKTLNKKAGGLFVALVLFAVTDREAVAKGMAATFDMKGVFKGEERAADVEMKVKMGENSTYRVVKNLICNCVKAGIPLVNADGKPRGKSELEQELAEGKVPKTEAEKFVVAMTTASNIAKKLDASECLTAAKLVADLMRSFEDRLSLKAAA
jgi:hypothetical protein